LCRLIVVDVNSDFTQDFHRGRVVGVIGDVPTTIQVQSALGKSQVANTAEEKSIGGLQIRAAQRLFPDGGRELGF
jgi:hypothetical protein